ncbi:MAG: hypothetical protein HRU35_02325 [Rickettsiaceae bacterium]|nr:hypothetical protein [Rickettsiaceae bacterium]
MGFNLDIAIFTIFVAVTLIVGILSSRGVTNISQFALGGRNFSTLALSATVIATWSSGSIFSYTISETYKNGLHFIIPFIGDGLVLVIIGYFLVPRMGEFLGKLSIAEALGEIYGKNSRLIISIIGILVCIGVTAAQFKVSSNLMKLLFGVSSFNATLISAMVVIFYSAFGGIRAVTFTDILQFFAFGTIIPIVTFFIWQSFNDHNALFINISNNPSFDYQEVFSFENPRFFVNLSILCYFMLPRLTPALFQRVSMAKNINQATKAFLIAGCCCLLVDMLICWIGILLYGSDSGLDPNDLFSSLLNNYSGFGFKGFIVSGVMAMIMSTSDSYINSSSVMFTNDFCEYFKLIQKKNEIIAIRAFSIIVGSFAFILAVKAQTILGLLMMIGGLYNAVLTVPLLFALFGFRSSSKSFLIAVTCGVTITTIWRIYFADSGIDSAIPGMLANFIGLFGTHYLLRQPGGWVGLKDGGRFAKIKKEKKYRWQKRIQNIKEFNFIRFCLKNRPDSEIAYPLFALFSIAAVYSGMFSIDEVIRAGHADILDKFFHSVIIICSIFLTYPIWPVSLKSDKFIGVTWTFSIFYILIFVSSFQLIISQFGGFQAMILMMNIIVLGLLSRWYISLFMTVIGVILSVQFFKLYMGIDSLPSSMVSTKFQLMYILLLSSSALLIFLKPKQDQLKVSEAKSDYFSEKFTEQQQRIEALEDVKNEILRNIPHESNTPLTGVTSLLESLCSNFNNLSREYIYDILKDIESSGERLKTFVQNTMDLSRLVTGKYDFKTGEVNLGELIYARVKICKKLYLEEKKKDFLQFYYDIEDDIRLSCDQRYITKVIDNIIINAIQYTDDGEININLTKDYKTNKILFTVSDQGIGIPTKDLYEIFAPFIVGSRTKTPAGGRGIGLAVAKEIVKLHKGKIWAESIEGKGSTFFVEL